MDSKLFLAIFLGVWLGITAYYATRFLIVAPAIRSVDNWAFRKAATLRAQMEKKNQTGRIIGFRPIENERG